MKIYITGTRGIPDIPGGVEKHCQELYPLIAAKGHEVFLATRGCYVQNKSAEWQSVHLIHLYCPKSKSLEAIVHTFLAVLHARWLGVDVIHIHAVGPGLMVPLARLLGLRVVVTNHGPDYDRQKWGVAAKQMLRLGEYLGGRFANEVIVISKVIADIVKRRCHRETHLIYNGVPLPQPGADTDQLEQFGLQIGVQYILAVARFVPEKGLHDLVKAMEGVSGDVHLVIAGDADHETEYSRSLRELARGDDRIILTGYVTGEPLHQLYSHASLFVLPSYHEGLPIVLLEAMSYGLSVLVSDIPANKEVTLEPERYFAVGDVEELQEKLNQYIGNTLSQNEQQGFSDRVARHYNWEEIAGQILSVYQAALEN